MKLPLRLLPLVLVLLLAAGCSTSAKPAAIGTAYPTAVQSDQPDEGAGAAVSPTASAGVVPTTEGSASAAPSPAEAGATSSPGASATPGQAASASPVAGAASPSGAPLRSCGEVALEKDGASASLPLYCVRGSYGLDQPNPDSAPPSPLRVSGYALPATVGKLAGYWLSYGGPEPARGLLILAPDGWVARDAAVGANGSSAIRMEDPSDPDQYVRYYDTGGCVGCAISEAGAYFPGLSDWAEKQGFPPGQSPAFLKRAQLGDRLVSYSLKAPGPGREINGVAWAKLDADDAGFRLLEAGLPGSRHDEASAILHFFVSQNPASPES
ncbi:DUF4850 domain-containing protein [Gorillibacterium sp. sgz500922]|uniref:DUF4850 domain-containing protein n=1 Tax=Gorillibacterium sp. sgz500922 TaxID=3446694 RepID=UPI003F66F0E4